MGLDLCRKDRERGARVGSATGRAWLAVLALLGGWGGATVAHAEPGAPEADGRPGEPGGEIRRVSSKDVRAIRRVAPDYPSAARGRGLEEQRCIATLTVSAEGVPVGVDVGGCDPLFEAPAVEALRQWRFEPVRVDGVGIEVQFRIAVVFREPPTGGSRRDPRAVADALPSGMGARAPDAQRIPGGPKVAHRVDPAYPDVEGDPPAGDVRCVAEVTTAPDGTVGDVEVRGCEPPFQRATDAAMRQWRFAPVARDGAFVATRVDVVVAYRQAPEGQRIVVAELLRGADAP